MKTLLELGLKIEQIALHAKTDEEHSAMIKRFGGEWQEDMVQAAHLSGEHEGSHNVARLSFNYDLVPGKELEIITYLGGNSWLDTRGTGLSHMGVHVEDIEHHKSLLLAEGLSIAQEVRTVLHTSLKVPENRRYHYVIFNTQFVLGFDLKLIQRLTV